MTRALATTKTMIAAFIKSAHPPAGTLPVNHLATKIHSTVKPAVTRAGIKMRRNLIYHSSFKEFYCPART